MPTSDHHNITPVLTIAQNLRPASVLEIGCGFGKYGVLLREYLDIWHERYERTTWRTRIEAVEAFPAYRTPVWDYVYDRVHLGDAAAVVPTLGRYDLILACDVVEHLDKPAAVRLVDACLDHAAVLIISTPREFYAQDEHNLNPFEVHRCLWTAADFPAGTYVATVGVLSCDVFVASRTPLSEAVLYPADPRDVLYLRSRNRLKRLGAPGWLLSRMLRWLNRALA